jgi:MFS family permease
MKTGEPKMHYGWIILMTGFLGVLGALGFGRFAYTPILPAMKEALALSYTQMGWIGAGNFIGYMAFSLGGGYLATRIGSRLVISTSLVLVAICLIVTGLSYSFAFAFGIRTFTGIASAGANVPIMALASAWFVSKRRGLATGILASGSSVALLLLGPLVPYILKIYPESGWRVCWFILGGLTLGIALVNGLLIRNHPEEKNLQPYGNSGQLPPASSPFSWRSLYASRSLWYLAGVFFSFGFSYVIYLQFFSAYLINEARVSPEKAGNYLMLLGILSIFCGPLWGTLSDFIGRKCGLALVLLTQGTAYLFFGLVKSPSGYLISTILFGLTAWSVPSIISAAIGDSVGARLAPAALGFVIFIFSIGQALSPPLAGKIADLTGSFTPAFILSSVVTFIGMGVALRMPKLSSTDM